MTKIATWAPGVTGLCCMLLTLSVRARSTSAAASSLSSFHNLNSIVVGDIKGNQPTAIVRESTPVQQQQPQQQQQQSSIWNDFSLMYRIYQQCSGENLSVCLKVKLLTGLEKAFRSSKELKIIEGIKFVSADEKSIAEGGGAAAKAIISEKDIEAVLPRSLEGKDHTLNSMIFNRLASFLQDHTLQVKFPNVQDMQEFSSESRKKKEKKGSGAFIMIPLLLGGTFIPIAYGALAMLAGKALIVSKLALVLASIIGIKKLLSGGGHKESQHEVVVSSGGHGSGWGRDFDLAYSAHMPKDPTKDI